MRRGHLIVIALSVALAVNCEAGAHAGNVAGRSSVTINAAGPGLVTVNGKMILAAGVTTVRSALTDSSTPAPLGSLLSVVDHQKIRDNTEVGKIFLNGLAAELNGAVRAGDVIVTVAGPNTTEPTTTSVRPFPTTTGATVLMGANPGTVRVVQGALSGELVSRLVLTEPVLGHLPAPGAIALTFDDGPDPVYTEQVLQLLAFHHVHATFCLIGRQAQQYPNLVKAIVAGGHTLCNHTWDHNENLPNLTETQISSEMTRAQTAITEASGGIAPTLFRAPGGAWSSQVEQIAHTLGMTPLKWTVDPRDWSTPGTKSIMRVVLSTLHPGGIVLLHDGGGKRGQTVAALTMLLIKLPLLHFTYAIPRA